MYIHIVYDFFILTTGTGMERRNPRLELYSIGYACYGTRQSLTTIRDPYMHHVRRTYSFVVAVCRTVPKYITRIHTV
jgi:hypothetical protein